MTSFRELIKEYKETIIGVSVVLIVLCVFVALLSLLSGYYMSNLFC